VHLSIVLNLDFMNTVHGTVHNFRPTSLSLSVIVLDSANIS
jgi:hypothetical protein